MAGDLLEMNNTAKLAAIDSLLSRIPAFQCKPGCHDCCGPVPMTRLELKRIASATSQTESALMRKINKAILVGFSRSDAEAEKAVCPLLGEHGCTVYAIRPAICRLFGSSEDKTPHSSLKCPHGCGPEKLLTAAETNSILNGVHRLGY